MKEMKRLLALVLCVVMLVGLLPVSAFAAEKQPVDAAIMFSDLHAFENDYDTDVLGGIMSALKETGAPFTSVTSCGDAFSVNNDSGNGDFNKFTGYTKTLADTIRGASGLGDSSVDVNFVWSDHDRYAVKEDGKTLLDKTSHVAYGAGNDGIVGTADDGNYYVYALSMADLASTDRYGAGYLSNRTNNGFTESVAVAIDNFEAEAAKMHKDRPLLITSHVPLLYKSKRADNANAYDWATAINAVAKDMDVAFFCGHNHKYDETNQDYYYAKGSSMTVMKTDKTTTSVKLNFPHVNVGYMEAVSSTSYNNMTRKEVAVGAFIYEDSIKLVAYDKDGIYEGTVGPLNVTIEREHAAVSVTLESIAISGKTEYTVGNENLELVVTATYSDGSTKPVTLESVLSGYDMTTAGTYTVKAEYEGKTATIDIVVNKAAEPEENKPVEVTVNGVTATITGVTVSASGAVSDADKALLDAKGYAAYVAMDVTATLTGESATVSFPIPAGWDADRIVGISVENGAVKEIPGTVADGKFTFSVTHFSASGIALLAEGETVNIGDSKWVTITAPTGGSTTYTYTRVNSITAGNEYVIVANNAEYALNYTVDSYGGYYTYATMTADPVDVSDDGSTMTSTSALKLWKFSGASGSVTISNGDYTVGYSSSMGVGSNRTAYVQNGNSNNFIIKRRNSNTGYALYYGTNGWASSNSSTAEYVRLYQLTGSTTTGGTNGLFGTIVGTKNYSVALNTPLEDVLPRIKEGVTVVYSEDGNATSGLVYADDGEGMTWTSDNYNPNVPGDYTVDVKYNGITLGSVTVTVMEGPAVQITEGGEVVEEVIVRKNAKVGDKVQLGTQTNLEGGTFAWSIPAEYAALATVDQNGLVTLKNNSAHFFVNVAWTVEGQTLTDRVEITATPHEYITPEQGTNDFPEYDNQGAIRFDKTAEAVGNFSETGIAQVELSMTGIPYGKGVDVVVVIDTSSSMKKDKNGTDQSSYTSPNARYQIMRESLKDMLTVFDGANVDLAIVDFNGYSSSNSNTGKENNINNANFPSGQSDRNNANKGKIYTGVNASKYIMSGTSTGGNIGGIANLGAQDFENTAADAFNEARINQIYGYFTGGSSGTNYDFGIECAYELLKDKKAANEAKGEARDQYVIFLTDGAPFRYNGFMANGADGRNEMNLLLSGEYADAAALKAAYSGMTDEVAAMYNPVNGAHLHRMAEAIKGTPGETYYAVDSTATTPYLKPFEGLGAKFFAIGFCIADDKTSSTSTDVVLEATSYEVIRNLSSGEGYYYEDVEEKSTLSGAFVNIATTIAQAASDIVVLDKITNEYTMVFDVPTGYDEDINADVQEALAGQEFYIEVGNYALNNDHERGAFTSNMKVYLGINTVDGVKSYYAATAANATNNASKYANPTFTAVSGEKAYWSVVDSSFVAGPDDILVTVGTTTYRFMELGDGTHNVTAGAYAYGTIDSYNNMAKELVIVTPYFAYSAKTKTLSWTISEVEEFKEIALRYFLYLDNSSTEIGNEGVEQDPGTYETNAWAHLTYTNHLGHVCRQEFPVPQITWNGAQVSYVFYLVNKNGQPINKAGEPVDFANATFITQTFTEAVIWNDTNTPTNQEGHAYLDAKWMAEDKLPEGYKLFDQSAYYELLVYEDHEGSDLNNYFKISGSEANGRTISTTKVYNTKGGTRYSAYGTYNKNNVVENFDFANTTVAFAVEWELALVPDTVVVDFGLDVLINAVANDLMQNSLTGLSDETGKSNLKLNTAIQTTGPVYTAKELTLKNGKYTAEIVNDAQIRFHQNDMQFTEPVIFYYGTSADDYDTGVKRTGYMHSSVTVIPATNVYYEDSFLDLTSYTKNGNAWNAQADETTKWTQTVSSAVQDQDRPGPSKISMVLDADNKYGYDKAYSTMSTYSMGNAAKITVDATTRGEATFTFYGTGFDVIGLTSGDTGTITVQVFQGDKATGTAVTTKMVDTYYGYAMNSDGQWELSPNAPDTLWQVPVMKVDGLGYNQYTVKIVAAYNTYFDHIGDGSYDLYLDAIRIYDPAGNTYDVKDENGEVTEKGNINSAIQDVYKADGEAWPIYEELRNKIIAASQVKVTTKQDGTLDVTIEGSESGALRGPVFIDSNDGTESIGDYVSYGPNNELYLANGQAIAFNLTVGTNVADVQLGIKVANGETVTYKINGDEYTVNSATDMFYSILKYAREGTVLIENVSGGILSITNIKMTHKSDPGSAATIDLWVDAPAVKFALMRMRPVSEPEVPETTVPETSVPEATEPEATVPETTEPEETKPAKPGKPNKEDKETKPTKPGKPDKEDKPGKEDKETKPTRPGKDNKNEKPGKTEVTQQPNYQEIVDTVVNNVVNAIKGLLGKLLK